MTQSNRARPAGVAVIAIVGLSALALLGGPTLAAGRSVAIRDSSFNPATITVRSGDTITWTNRSGLAHNVMFASFGSKMYMDAGERYSHTFLSAGTFSYSCTLHGFTGKVIVIRAAATPKPTPKPTKRPTPKPTAPPATPSPSRAPAPAATPKPTPSSIAAASPLPSRGSISSPIPSQGSITSPVPAPSVVGTTAPPTDTGAPGIALVVAGLVGAGAFLVRRR
jgi:plastocyanin